MDPKKQNVLHHKKPVFQFAKKVGESYTRILVNKYFIFTVLSPPAPHAVKLASLRPHWIPNSGFILYERCKHSTPPSILNVFIFSLNGPPKNFGCKKILIWADLISKSKRELEKKTYLKFRPNLRKWITLSWRLITQNFASRVQRGGEV